MRFDNREDILQLTPLWKGERFEDGRPKVPDSDIEKLKTLTQEQVWEPIWRLGYLNQFEANLRAVHNDGRKLIGRAVTAAYLPSRPDLFDVVEKTGQEEGRRGTHNLWVVDKLTEGDVCVVDMFDKIKEGTFVGGNLSTAISARTKTGGAVIWGGIRDLEQINKIDSIQIYYRGCDPTPIMDFVMSGYNCPVRIGGAVCLPGDIVYGYTEGVLFIPSHLVAYAINEAYKTKAKDIFGFDRLEKGIYTTADIDRDTWLWPKHMIDELVQFIDEDPRGEQYRGLDWSHEYQSSKEKYGW